VKREGDRSLQTRARRERPTGVHSRQAEEREGYRLVHRGNTGSRN
jgi:hypothetical protein